LVIAVAYDEKLDQSDKAVEYFRLAQEIEPEDASALGGPGTTLHPDRALARFWSTP